MGMTLAAELHIDEPRLRVTEGDAWTALRTVIGRPVVSPGPGCVSAPAAPASRSPGCSTAPSSRPRAQVSTRDCSSSPTAARRRRRTSSGCAVRATASRTGSTARPAAFRSSCGRRACTRPRARTGPGRRGRRSRRAPHRTGQRAGRRGPRGAVRRHRSRSGREHRRSRIRPRCHRRGAHRRHHHDPHLRGVPPDRRHGESDPRRARRAAGIEDFRVDWQWIPAWRPADITDGGREQLRAIGFTI